MSSFEKLSEAEQENYLYLDKKADDTGNYYSPEYISFVAFFHYHPNLIEDASESGTIEVSLKFIKDNYPVAYSLLSDSYQDTWRTIKTLSRNTGRVFSEGYRTYLEENNCPSSELPDDVLGSYDVRLVDFPDDNIYNIGKANNDKFGKLVKVSGICTQASEQQPRIIEAVFECELCGDFEHEDLEGRFKFKLPKKCYSCDSKGSMFLNVEESIPHAYQQLKIQESPDEAENPADPATVTVEVIGDDLVGTAQVGERVDVIGTLNHFSEKDTTVIQTFIDADVIEQQETSFSMLELSEKDVDEIIQFRDDHEDDLINIFADSIAPHIIGHDSKKQAIVLQLVGGVTREKGSERKRGDIHILFIGTPATAKTDLLEAAHRISPLSQLTSGEGASGVGLTATVTEEEIAGETQWVAKAGTVVLADQGLACIDEFDKVSDADKKKLVRALGSGEVTLAKASINTALNARVSALVAANPIDGDFDLNGNIIDQFNLSPELFSRFDLTFPFYDIPDENVDKDIAESMLNIHTDNDIDNEYIVDEEFMRRYVAYARREFEPVLSEEAKNQLVEFYSKFRNGMYNSAIGDVPIDARDLNTLVRLATASARLRLSDTVSEHDANIAINMVTTMVNDIRVNENGNFDTTVQITQHGDGL